jgi:hypothetical protein
MSEPANWLEYVPVVIVPGVPHFSGVAVGVCVGTIVGVSVGIGVWVKVGDKVEVELGSNVGDGEIEFWIISGVCPGVLTRPRSTGLLPGRQAEMARGINISNQNR